MLKALTDYLMALANSKIKNERGQGMVEYGLIIGLVAVLLIGALVAMRGQLETIFQSITNALNGGTSTTP